MKMKRLLILVFVSFLFLNCAENNLEAKREVKFSGGNKGEVSLDFIKGTNGKEILHVTYTKDKQVIKIADVDKDVEEIWSQVKGEAEKKDVYEGLIKYVYVSEFEEGSNTPIYLILLFETERIENGSWTINRVN